jgi:hypothetical protein
MLQNIFCAKITFYNHLKNRILLWEHSVEDQVARLRCAAHSVEILGPSRMLRKQCCG